jgi:DNA-binding MarR family transcriptional regulator
VKYIVIRHIGRRAPTDDEFRALAELRTRLRRFLEFSAARARAAGLQPQQHQALLALRGAPRHVSPTVGYLAEALRLRHNSAVGLVDRLARRGLVARRRSPHDRRHVVVRLTRRGDAALRPLAQHHLHELRSVGPELRRSLGQLLRPASRHRHPS